jgi:hypothetical protein
VKVDMNLFEAMQPNHRRHSGTVGSGIYTRHASSYGESQKLVNGAHQSQAHHEDQRKLVLPTTEFLAARAAALIAQEAERAASGEYSEPRGELVITAPIALTAARVGVVRIRRLTKKSTRLSLGDRNERKSM